MVWVGCWPAGIKGLGAALAVSRERACALLLAIAECLRVSCLGRTNSCPPNPPVWGTLGLAYAAPAKYHYFDQFGDASPVSGEKSLDDAADCWASRRRGKNMLLPIYA